MDDRGCRKWCELPRKTLHFVSLLSFFSFLYSYSSGSSSYNLHLSTFIFSLFAHAMDRNYVFLVCNLILAFLLNNFTFYGSTNPAAAADAPHQHTLNQMPALLSPECTCHPLHQHNLQEDDDDQEEEDLKEDEAKAEAGPGSSTLEEVTDASVSTEELNQKFEEFIRKMKEEIRIEAQQQPIPVSNHSFS